MRIDALVGIANKEHVVLSHWYGNAQQRQCGGAEVLRLIDDNRLDPDVRAVLVQQCQRVI